MPGIVGFERGPMGGVLLYEDSTGQILRIPAGTEELFGARRADTPIAARLDARARSVDGDPALTAERLTALTMEDPPDVGVAPLSASSAGGVRAALGRGVPAGEGDVDLLGRMAQEREKKQGISQAISRIFGRR